jgi:hypothetical protein
MYPDLVSTESNAKAEPESEIIIGSQCLAIISEMESAYSMTSANAQDYWYADSGATEHMSDRLDWMYNFKPIPTGQWPVTTADDSQHWVCGIGDVQLVWPPDHLQEEKHNQSGIFDHQDRQQNLNRSSQVRKVEGRLCREAHNPECPGGIERYA